MREDLVWYHVIWNTHNSWLPGDPRGFRDHDHRIHSTGDYKNPPPAGEHANLYQYNQARAGPAIRLPASLRQAVVEGVLDAMTRRDFAAAALSVGAEHVHVLAMLPPDYDEAKAAVGKLKTVSSLLIRDRIPGTVWSRGCVLKRIQDESHWQATHVYITEKQEPGTHVWRSAPTVEEPAASAAASIDSPRDSDAAAEAAGSSTDTQNDFDPNHFTQSDAIEVRRVTNRGKGGRAVFARRDIAAGEIIERVPVLMIPRTQVFGPDDIAQRAARISWYVFEWLPTKRGYVALSLGYGSIYNHSDAPNAEYDMEPPDVMIFSAIKPIEAGDEVLISYAGGAGIMKELGFAAEKNPPLAMDLSPLPTAEGGKGDGSAEADSA